ncbi:MAG: YdcF family protein [Ignavibacteriales bacterium]|nr:YdcF family protein [Ignavibacteriales bacterium]
MKNLSGNQSHNSFLLLAFFSVLEIVLMVFVFFLKYRINYVPLSELSFQATGNLLSFIISIATLSVAALIHVRFKQSSVLLFKAAIVLKIFAIIELLTAFLIFRYDVGIPVGYIYSFTYKKILMSGMLMLPHVLNIFVLLILFGSFFSKGALIFFKAFVNSLLLILLLIIISFAFSQSFSENELVSGNRENFQIGVVLGAAVWSNNQPSTLFEGRIEKAFELWKKNKIKKIYLTGGKAPGELTEARAAFNYLIRKGVPKKDLMLEEKTSTTAEQIRHIRRKLVNSMNYREVVIISDHFHLKRILEMCKFYGINAKGIASDYSMGFEQLLFYRLRDSIGLLLFWFAAI